MQKSGNALVMQSGGPTPVINRSLYGVVQEGMVTGAFPKLYGARHAIDGVLTGDFLDLSRTPQNEWERIAATPGSALGTTRSKLKTEHIPRVIEHLKNHDIRYWFMIGGNDSAENARSVAVEAEREGYELSVIHIPKTVDNDLVLTDHTPGYGSAARFIAYATLGSGRDAEAMGKAAPITILEVMGRYSGWMAAASILAKQEERDAPHVIVIPEIPLDENEFLRLVEDAYRKYGFAVAVVEENVRDRNGKPLGDKQEPFYVDDFGHAYYEGAGHYLTALAAKHFKTRVRYDRPNTIQRSFQPVISTSDAREAEMAGRAAVRAALAGETQKMVSLVREPGDEYVCTTGLVPLDEVATAVRTMPPEYLDTANSLVTDAFVAYALPLIGEPPLPRFGRVRG